MSKQSTPSAGDGYRTYTIKKTATVPRLYASWESEDWASAQVAEVAYFHSKSSDHRPVTRVKVLYDERNLYVSFRVNDRYVRAVRTRYQDFVANDSCVEFFVWPVEGKGYFNFEANCIGTLLLCYIEDWRRKGMGFEQYTRVPTDKSAGIEIVAGLKPPLKKELTEPITWEIAYNIPFSLLDFYTGCGTPSSDCSWRGNFYKCGDETSHPHWAAWNPIGVKLDFHQPDRFGKLVFA